MEGVGEHDVGVAPRHKSRVERATLAAWRCAARSPRPHKLRPRNAFIIICWPNRCILVAPRG